MIRSQFKSVPLLFCLLGSLLLPAISGATTPTITVSPVAVVLADGQAVPYTAKVAGLSSTTVKWEVNGIVGGNATVGTITTAGLYKAPSSTNGLAKVMTIAAVGSDNKTTGSTTAKVAPPGPKITSISPNPITPGKYTITIHGSGFAAGAFVRNVGVGLTATYVSSTEITATGVQTSTANGSFEVQEPQTAWGPAFVVPFKATVAATIAPTTASLAVGAKLQFTSTGSTSWSALHGTITAAGLYTAPSTYPSTGNDVISVNGANGAASETITILKPAAPPAPTSGTPTITSVSSSSSIPLGLFAVTVSGTNFSSGSVASMCGSNAQTTYVSATQLNISGFCGTPGASTVTVVSSAATTAPYPVQIGVVNPKASPAAARRLLEQAAFGPNPATAVNVQSVGIPAWVSAQLAMAPVSTYKSVTTSFGGMPEQYLTNAVNQPDQLRQRVAFALSQLFVTSLLEVGNQSMVNYQDMLLNDSFVNYRQIMSDVTLSPAMGQYLNMGNNAKADPTVGSLANENFARELMQLFTIGTNMLNDDGSMQLDSDGQPIPTYSQFTVTEFARVYTGWTYAPAAGTTVSWGHIPNNNGPMVPIAADHDSGSKQLLNGYVSPSGVTPQVDLNNALDNIFNHPNVGPFVGRQLIQHLVKSNPSPAYVGRVAAAFNDNGSGVRGDMKAVITAILLDPEARANDEGGADQASDGRLQEPALYVAAMVRAFNGTMNDQNVYAWYLSIEGQDIFSPPSVFNYYPPNYVVPGTSLNGGEFEIFSPNNAVLRANLVTGLFGSFSSPIASSSAGTVVDLTAFVPLGSNPTTLVNAMDLTLTHGVMPAAMKEAIITAVTNEPNGNLRRVQKALYLTITSSYYNVWH